eukprot:m.30882 g.30882  ORF g.30882 m.30882 type:complete len:211 (+) comp9671_c0_seq1:166-798(+)
MGNANISSIEPVCCYLRHQYNSKGEKRLGPMVQKGNHDCMEEQQHWDECDPSSVRDQLPFYSVQKKYWRQLKEDRSKSIFARKKLSDNNISKWKTLYPCWTESDFADLKDQFHSFDVNQDGMIDFEEMCTVLDEIGDATNQTQRRKGFDEVDIDDSGTIDFEEFLALVHKVRTGEMDSTYGFGKAYKRTARSTMAGHHLSIPLQVQYQLL